MILIIGILAAVAMPAFLNQKGKANDANTKSDARTGQTAQETYFTDNQTYANGAAGLTSLEGIEPTLTQAAQTVANGGDLLTVESPATAVFGATLAGGETNANSFDVQATSKSGVQYAVVRRADGQVQRTCNVPANTNPAGCKLPAGQNSGNGTW